DDGATPAAWYPLIADSIREAEDAGEEALLDRIRERGSWGRSEVLNLLNNGQVDILVLPFDVDLRVWLAEDSQTLAPTEQALQMQRPDDTFREVRLTDVLSELVRRHSFKVEFMDGPQKDRLKNDFRGIAALRRWWGRTFSEHAGGCSRPGAAFFRYAFRSCQFRNNSANAHLNAGYGAGWLPDRSTVSFRRHPASRRASPVNWLPSAWKRWRRLKAASPSG